MKIQTSPSVTLATSQVLKNLVLLVAVLVGAGSGRLDLGSKSYGQGCPGGVRPGYLKGWKWSH